MSAVVHARVTEHLMRLRLRYVADRLDALLNDAARTEPTYLDFLDSVLRQEVDAKQRTRVTMALKIAHFPSVKTLEDFEFKFQPSIHQRLMRELATGRFIAQGETEPSLTSPRAVSMCIDIARRSFSFRQQSQLLRAEAAALPQDRDRPVRRRADSTRSWQYCPSRSRPTRAARTGCAGT
jgi:hypothetical protein